MAHKKLITSYGILVLAAGSSVRMGTPKQLLLFRGMTLLKQAATTALCMGAGATLIVLGAKAARMREEIMELPVDILINQRHREGMASSIVEGLRYMVDKHPEICGVLIMVCDQPFADAGHLAKLVRLQRDSGKFIVASQYKNRKGVPAFFHQDLFDELLRLKGDKGARDIIDHHEGQSLSVPFPLGYIDLDTPEDYHALLLSADGGNKGSNGVKMPSLADKK